jgi:ATP-dependent helicase HrpB
MRTGLPIDVALPELCAALSDGGQAVLVAPPGAGKSTVVPLALLDAPWRRGRRILLLEPRRLAARAVAQRMASSLGEGVGARVGYRMRFDTRVSAATQIEVITEGVLTRLLQADPALESVAAVLFDEFHERSLQADLGLALCLDARASLRPDLRLLVMSATLDGERVADLLGHAPIVRAQGRSFDVETIYAGRSAPPLPAPREPIEPAVAALVRRALTEQSGDLLVFLPGAREIRRCADLLESDTQAARVSMLPLYGELSVAEQDRALLLDPDGRRRVVLATNIAETSLTIPGIRVVVDSGLVRESRFDPNTGLSRLETTRVSRASAEQRQGRAGRVAAGVCYRLWSEAAQRSLAAHNDAEILTTDLTPLALELAGWGIVDAGQLRWLDVPPVAMLDAARDLLQRLGALGSNRRITAQGRELLRVPTHPRIAQMLLFAQRHDVVEQACRVAALLSDREAPRLGSGRDLDLQSRLDALRSAPRELAARLQRNAEQLMRALPRRPPAANKPNHTATRDTLGSALEISLGALLAQAYPDRIAQHRGGEGGRFLLANGRGVSLAHSDALGNNEFIVAIEVDDRDRDGRLLLGTAVTRAEIERHLAASIAASDDIFWDSREQAVVARRRRLLGAIVLDSEVLAEPDLERQRTAMITGMTELGLKALPWTEAILEWRQRVAFAGAHDLPPGGWPDLSDAALAATLPRWLGPYLAGITRRSHLPRVPLTDALSALLDPRARRALDEQVPTHITLPTGTQTRIDYSDVAAPSAAMRMQEVFGLAATPRIANGKVPITFKLLSPAQRPLQVTRDLASFWRNAYIEVRKDMRGQYPKHYWPEDPLQAEPMRGAKRRRRR